MGKVTIPIEFRILEILVSHRICHTRNDRITVMYFSTASVKTCSFSEGNLDEEISSASVVSMTPSENIC